jgi:hypothetical protein
VVSQSRPVVRGDGRYVSEYRETREDPPPPPPPGY